VHKSSTLVLADADTRRASAQHAFREALSSAVALTAMRAAGARETTPPWEEAVQLTAREAAGPRPPRGAAARALRKAASSQMTPRSSRSRIQRVPHGNEARATRAVSSGTGPIGSWRSDTGGPRSWSKVNRHPIAAPGANGTAAIGPCRCRRRPLGPFASGIERAEEPLRRGNISRAPSTRSRDLCVQGVPAVLLPPCGQVLQGRP
jgi:hypothetical protein